MFSSRPADLVLDARAWLHRRLVIAPGTRRAAAFGSFGAGSAITFPAEAIFGEHAIHIGEDTLVGPHAALTVGLAPGQELMGDRMLVIGDRCSLGRGTAVAAHWSIEIGDDVYFGPNVFVTDQNHSNAEPGVPIGRQSQPEEPVRIGARSWLGANVVVTPGVTIGTDVIVGANSVVTTDVPDGSVVGGVPARQLNG